MGGRAVPELLSLAVGFVVGALLAWLAATLICRTRALGEIAGERARAQAAEQLVAELRRQTEQRDRELADLDRTLQQERQAATEARTRMQVMQQAAEEQRRLLDEAGNRFADTFKALSADALLANNQSFLDLAKQSLEAILAEARGDIDRRQQAIQSLVRPLHDALTRYDDQIRQLESKRDQDYGNLSAQLKELTSTEQRLQKETANLVTALRNPRVRGRWGELTLRRVVELAGLVDHCDFTEQKTVASENARLRPDLIVHLPVGRQVVVDAKVPLEAYLDALAAPSEDEQRAALVHHAQQVRTHLNALGVKAYWDQFPNTPEFVVMFIPGEAFLQAAVEVDPTLIEDGLSRRVVVATPTTLVAIMRAVAFGWRQEQIAENAKGTSNLGRQLYERLRTLAEHFADVGTSLGRAVTAYNKTVNSLETRVLTAARRFQELGAAAGEEILSLEPVDEAPRALAAATDERGPEAEGR